MTMTDAERHLPPDDDMWGYLNTTDDAPIEPTIDPEAVRAATEERKRRRLAEETEQQLLRLRARAAAKALFEAEQAGDIRPPAGITLTDFLRQPFEPTRYRIDGLWPRRGHVILAAAFKAGKTTMRDNLVRHLVDGGRFLGIYPVDQVVDGRVGVIDFEMPPNKLQEWLRDQGITNTDQVVLWTLRGQARQFDLRNDLVRAAWAEQIKSAQVRVLVVDCLGPILSALGADENGQKDVGPVLDALTSLAVEAGVDEVLLIHHMGHGAERSRGASRLRDWPDAEWRLVRQKDDDNPFGDPDPAAPRFFAAFGRDVNVREGQLVYDHATRRLVYADGNRREARANLALVFVLTWVRDNPGVTVRGIQDEAARRDGLSRDLAREAIKQAVGQGLVRESAGANRSKSHSVTAAGFAFLSTPAVAEPDEPAAPAVVVGSCFGCYRPVPVSGSVTAWCPDCASGGGSE